MPKVSVIIPAYNRASLLKEAVESVLQQSFSDFELIVVDDGSTDATRELIKDYPAVRYIYQPNKGVSSARNQGIKQAVGDLIAFLDSDDLWIDNKLERQVTFFNDNPAVSICQSEEIWLRDGRRHNPKKKHKKYSGYILKECLPLCIVSPTAVMLRREVFQKIGLFDESFPVCEDYDFWLRAARVYPIELIKEPLIIKRAKFPDQLSFRYWGMDRFRLKAIKKLLKKELPPEIRKMALKVFREKRKIFIRGCLKRRHYLSALFYSVGKYNIFPFKTR